MELLLQYTLLFASILMIVAIGGCFSEHSGVINLGLEGIMVIGALGGALIMRFLQDKFERPNYLLVIVLTVLASALFGLLYSLFLAVASVSFRADQTIIGTAMNILATAVATVAVKAINLSKDPTKPSSTVMYNVSKDAFIVRIGDFELNWLVVLSVVLLGLSVYVLYYTSFGLRLIACGEHPQAADSVGINVHLMRYLGVMISGVLGGIGGVTYIIAGSSQWQFEYGVAGFGFLALAVMIFGQWKPHRIALSALLFGLFRALSNVYSGIDFINALNIPSQIYNMMPYIICLIVLAFTSKKSRAPKAEGIPYDKGQR